MNPYQTSPTTSIDVATPPMPINLGASLFVSYLQCYLVCGACYASEAVLVAIRYGYYSSLSKELLRLNFWLFNGMKVFLFSLVIFALLSAIDFFPKSTRVRVGLYVLCSLAVSCLTVILWVLPGIHLVVRTIALHAGFFILPCLAYSLFRITRQKTSATVWM